MHAAGTLTLDTLLKEQAVLRAAMPAIGSGAAGTTTVRWLSYGDLDAQCDAAASILRRLGIGRGDVVGLLLPNSEMFPIALLGAMRAGAVAMPMQALSTASEIAYVLKHARCQTVITTSAFRQILEEAQHLGEPLFTLLEAQPGGADGWKVEHSAGLVSQPSPLDRSLAGNQAPALLLYSSGSTARPKGVVISHEAAIAAGQCNAWHQALRPADRHGIVLPLYHCNALFLQFFAALSVGASVYLGSSFRPDRYWDEMVAADVTLGNLVATGIRKLLQQAPTPPPGRMRLMTYGMPLTREELDGFESRYGCPLANVYGLTETAACGMRSPPYQRRLPERLGLPMPGWQARIIGDDGSECSDGVPGEIWLKGPSLFSEYLGDPVESARCLRDGGLLTGDIGYFDEDGFLVLVDRKKDLIKVRARSVGSLEIETVLNEHPCVIDCSVIGIPDTTSDERIVAFIVPMSGVTEAELTAFCAQRLAHYKVPRQFVFHDSLPKTSVGKTRKAELKQEFLRSAAASDIHGVQLRTQTLPSTRRQE